METAERSTPPIERAPQASGAETPRSAEPRRPAAAPAPPPAPVPKSPQPAARTFTRRYVLDVPLYTAPLALLLLGLGWQITEQNTQDVTLFGLAGFGLGLAAATVIVQRLLPPETLQENAPPPRLWALVAFLVFAPVTALPPSMIVAEPTVGSNYIFTTFLLFYTVFILTFYTYCKIFTPHRNFNYVIITMHIFCVMPLTYISFIFSTFVSNLWTSLTSISILLPSILVIRSYEIDRFPHKFLPSTLSIIQLSIFIFIFYSIYRPDSDIYKLLMCIIFLSFIFILSYLLRKQLLLLVSSPPSKSAGEAPRRPRSATAPYALVPAFLLSIVLISAIILLAPWTPGKASAFVHMAAWPILLGYTFLFASPLPRLLLEAELRGAPVPGASYADFRRLSRLGVSDDLARRGARAIVAAALAGLARWVRALPAHLAPWIAVTLVLGVVLMPWPLWLGGASPAPLILPIAVWAAARWGRRALPPLAVVLVPHAIGLSLPVQDGNALPQLLGAPGFVAATLFWARFTADADLRRRLLTQERFGLGALLALALLAGCVSMCHFQSADGFKAILMLNLLWPAASLVLVWGLSRAPIGGAVAVLLLLMWLRVGLYDLGWWPQALSIPLQFSLGDAVLIVEPPLFGLPARRVTWLVLLALFARFAVRQGLLPDARRETRFSSPLSRTAGATLTIMYATANLDFGLGPGMGLARSTLDVATPPQEPFLLAIGFILGLWVARPLRHLPGDLVLGWAPRGGLIGVLIGVALLVALKQQGGPDLASLLVQLGSPYTVASLASFLAFVVFGHFVRRAAEGRRRRPETRTAQGHADTARDGQALLWAGPTAVLDDLLGRDRRVPLARVIDATFAQPRARRLQEPGVTSPMLADAAPRPFAEVFEPPVRAASPVRLALGRLGMLLLVLNISIAAAAITAGLRQPAAAPAETQQPQQQQPATLRENGGKAPPSAR